MSDMRSKEMYVHVDDRAQYISVQASVLLPGDSGCCNWQYPGCHGEHV